MSASSDELAPPARNLPAGETTGRRILTTAVTTVASMILLSCLATFLVAWRALDTGESDPGQLRRDFLMALALLAVAGGLAIEFMRRRIRPLVGELVAARDSAERNEARLLAAAENSPDGFSTFAVERDDSGAIVDFRVTYQNASAARLWHDGPRRNTGARLTELLTEPLLREVLEQYARVVQDGAPLREERPSLTTGTDVEWMEHQVVKLGDGVAVTQRDITERRRADERLRHMAQVDSLTGLPNRAVFYDRLEQAIVRARRSRRPFGLLFMDVDHFKDINDRLGHASGDALLRKFAERLRRAVRSADTVARLAGDEFTVILEDLHQEEDVERVANMILRTVRAPLRLGDEPLQVTVSIGAALFKGEDIGFTELVERADIALYEVKRRGRDAFVLYTPAIDARGAAADQLTAVTGVWKAV